MSDTPAISKLRIDKWLWYARVAKTRSLAATLVKTGKVRVNTQRVSSPSSTVKIDDVLTITLARQIKVLRVLAIGERRGPAAQAQLLYEDLSPPVVKPKLSDRPAKQAVRDEGAGRPTKRERRILNRFRANAGQDFGSDSDLG